jgi:hypothetical protein
MRQKTVKVNLIVAKPIKKFKAFMIPEGSLPCLQDPMAGLCMFKRIKIIKRLLHSVEVKWTPENIFSVYLDLYYYKLNNVIM